MRNLQLSVYLNMLQLNIYHRYNNYSHYQEWVTKIYKPFYFGKNADMSATIDSITRKDYEDIYKLDKNITQEAKTLMEHILVDLPNYIQFTVDPTYISIQYYPTKWFTYSTKGDILNSTEIMLCERELSLNTFFRTLPTQDQDNFLDLLLSTDLTNVNIAVEMLNLKTK